MACLINFLCCCKKRQKPTPNKESLEKNPLIVETCEIEVDENLKKVIEEREEIIRIQFSLLEKVRLDNNCGEVCNSLSEKENKIFELEKILNALRDEINNYKDQLNEMKNNTVSMANYIEVNQKHNAMNQQLNLYINEYKDLEQKHNLLINSYNELNQNYTMAYNAYLAYTQQCELLQNEKTALELKIQSLQPIQETPINPLEANEYNPENP